MRTAPFALLLDALHQVLDNWVFRILAVLSGAVVLSAFLIGFREDGMVLLFGVRSWGYAELFAMFGTPMPTGDLQGEALQSYLSFVFDYLAGGVGVVFCIAATSFFVPQMIEKGAADVLFHKPLARLTFYLARYVSGLLFIGLLSTAMAVGIYLGVLLVSGVHDPGILVAGPQLTYVFALVYPVSMAVGVMTRSTVAAILLTTIFFSFNGCVHFAWEQMSAAKVSPERAEVVLGEAAEAAALVEPGGDGEVEPGPGTKEEDEGLSFLGLLEDATTVLHIALPKTRDADRMARAVRREVNAPLFRDRETDLCVFRTPRGMAETTPKPPGDAVRIPGLTGPTGLLGEPIYALVDPDTTLRVDVFRRRASEREVERRSGTRLVTESARDGAVRLAEALAADPSALGVDRSLRTFGSSARGGSASSHVVEWSWQTGAEGAAGAARVVVFVASRGWIHTIWIADAGPAATEELLARVSPAMGFDAVGEGRPRLLGPWRSSLLFSVGSSAAFVVLLLGLGWWRLSRIEF